MKDLGIILNTNTKIFREKPSEAGIIRNLVEPHHERVLLKITERDEQVVETAKEFKSRSIAMLGLVGGDGTLQSTLSHFIEVYGDVPLPRIAILRGGTNNTVATSLNIKGSARKLLGRLIENFRTARELKTVKRNLINVNGAYGFIFGNGFFHNFLKIYHERAYPSRLKGFILLCRAALSALARSPLSRDVFRSFNASLSIDGEKISIEQFSALSCSSVPHIGYGFNMYSKALDKVECFHLVGFPKNPRLVAASMPGLYFGRIPKSGGFISRAAREVVFETEEPIGYQLDGENRVDSRKFTIRTGPRLEFIIS